MGLGGIGRYGTGIAGIGIWYYYHTRVVYVERY
jgi:hypothetical protein